MVVQLGAGRTGNLQHYHREFLQVSQPPLAVVSHDPLLLIDFADSPAI